MMWSQSPCGEYTIEDGPKGLYVVLTFSDGSSVFSEIDADIIRQEWAECVIAEDFSILEEYRYIADPPEVKA